MSPPGSPVPPAVPGYAVVPPPLDAEPGATVWKATHARTGRVVALTVFGESAELDWLFLRRTVERLVRVERGHERVAALLDADLGADPPYYAAELVEGGTLADFAVAARRPAVGQAVGWITQLAQALSFLHAKGVLHCGLTPARVRLDAEGQVRVTGVGHRAAATAGGPWTAPEQTAGGEPDVRWDVWALGAIAHGLLAGAPPPAGGIGMAPAGVDEELWAIVGHCLGRNPGRRYGSTGAVLADLAARAQGRPVGPLADRRGYRLRLAWRRHKVTASVAALVVAGLGVTGWQGIRRAEAQRGLGTSLLLRAQQAAAQGNDTAAALYAAQANVIVPSGYARMSALAFLRGLAEPVRSFPQRWATGGAGLIAFSPDGARLAVGEADGVVRFWKVSDGSPAGEITGQPANIQNVSFTRDGKLLLVADHNGTMRCFDGATLAAVSPVMAHQRKILAAAFTPDGRRLVTAGEDGVACVWDPRTGKRVGEPVKHSAAVTFLAMAPDGRLAATACGQGTELKVLDPRTARVIRTEKEPASVLALAFAPNGNVLLVGFADGSAVLTDVRTGARIGNPIYHRIGLTGAVFTPDGKRLVTGGWDGVVAVWDARTGAPQGELGRHDNGVLALAVHPDGRRIISASADGTVRLWDLMTWNQAGPVMLHEAAVHHAVFSPDGKFIASAGEDCMARLWAVDPPRSDERRVEFPAPGLLAAAFAPGGDMLATAHQGGVVVLTQTGEDTKSATAFTVAGTIRDLGYVEPAGRRVLWVVTWEGGVRFLDPVTRGAAGKPIEPGGLSAWAFSRDGRMLATFGYDFVLRLWKVPEGEPVGPAFRHEGGGPVLVFSPDGSRLFSGGYDGNVRGWKVPGGESTGEPVLLEGVPSSVVFSPDGRLALAVCYDGDLRLFDPASWRRVGETMAHPLTVSAYAFTPDGSRILSGAFEYSVFVWDGRGRGRVGKSFRLSRFAQSVAVTPDGALGAVAGWGGSVQLVDIASGDPVGPAMSAGGDIRASTFGGGGRRLAVASAGENAMRVWDLTGILAAPSPAFLLRRVQAVTHRRVSRDSDIEPIPYAEWKALAARDGSTGGPR